MTKLVMKIFLFIFNTKIHKYMIGNFCYNFLCKNLTKTLSFLKDKLKKLQKTKYFKK